MNRRHAERKRRKQLAYLKRYPYKAPNDAPHDAHCWTGERACRLIYTNGGFIAPIILPKIVILA